MTDQTISISLDLRLAGDSLTGRVRNGTGPDREFTGWIGLVAAIDALCAGCPPSKEGLAATLTGAVVAPGDERWDAARRAFNLAVDQRPELVAFPADENDVAAVVRYARANGLRVAAQRTGHNASPMASLDGAVLLNTSAMQGVEIDPGARRARVRAGAQWAQVSDLASEHGLAGLAGSSRDVGVVGYHLGGGLSFIGRKHGLAANSVRAIEIVTADGELRRVDHDNEPDLFWALRGGGGNFGVVTALEFDLFPAPEIFAGTLFYPVERAPEALHAWRELTAIAPDELTTIARILRFPPLPEVPEPVRGRSLAAIGVIFLGGEADGADLIQPLRALGPEMDTLGMVPPAALGHVHMDPEDPMPYLSEHLLTDELPAKAIDDMLALTGAGSGSTLAAMELRHSGGALARRKPGNGALAALPGSFVMFAGGAIFEEGDVPVVESQLAAVRELFAPYEAGPLFDADTHDRLLAVKQDHDPDGLFQANHELEGSAR